MCFTKMVLYVEIRLDKYLLLLYNYKVYVYVLTKGSVADDYHYFTWSVPRSERSGGMEKNEHFDRELISVVMGVMYRRQELDTLRRAVDSILCQTHGALELIICEKGSSEAAKQLLREYADADSRVRLIDGTAAENFSAQLNMCIQAAGGRWIARMDDDDMSFPERLEKQLAFLKAHEEFGFVGCNVRLIQDGEDIGAQRFPEAPTVKDFLFSMPFIHPTLMFRRDVLDAVQCYSVLPRCNRCEDYDILMRLYGKGICGANMDKEYFAYTLPSQGITNRSFGDRVNEMKTRFACFGQLGLMPKAFPYAVKPLVLWFMPKRLLAKLKRKRNVDKG